MPRDVQLSVRTLPGGFEAAEIDGLRPTDAADDAVRAIVRNALWERGVACLRFADGLDDDQARAVASMIGPIKDPIGRTRDGGELRYSEDRQIIDAGFVLTDDLRERWAIFRSAGSTRTVPACSRRSTPTIHTSSGLLP